MNRLRVRVFSALAAFAVALGVLLPATAQETGTPNFWFAGTRLVFDRAIPLDGDVAVSIRDSGLQKFLARLGATVAYQPQQRYVVITAADHRTITFTIGTAEYLAGGVSARATFAPLLQDNEPILPLYALAHALYVEPVAGAGETVLQPQIGALDIRTQGHQAVVVIRGATALAWVKRVDTPTHVEIAFGGVASTLSGTRRIGAGTTATISSGGSARNPSTIIAFDAPRGLGYEIAAGSSPYELALTINDAGGDVAAIPPAPPAPVPLPSYAAISVQTPPPGVAGGPLPVVSAAPGDAGPLPSPSGPAVVTAITLLPQGDGLAIHAAIEGSAAFDWHRYPGPDGERWYVDIQNAQLTGAGRVEQPTVAAVDSVRIQQFGTAVRIALTLRGEKQVDVEVTGDGLTISATNVDAIAAVRTGSGHVGVAAIGDGPPPVALATPSSLPTPWKFGNVNGSRIIVLDPGHGGDDFGTAHNGLIEKNLTIDIARRLRRLLTAAGWNVRMTRDGDIDPVSDSNLAAMRADGKPNPTDRAYLQTRCDVANDVNARMFISIHVNYSDSPSINGTTFYWYKPEDQQLAQTLERAVIPLAGTNDVGPRHENFYVIRHTTMPAVLIETAFISNPHDAELLQTPSFLQHLAQGIANGVKAYAGVPGAQASRVDQ